jgi:hypothetical protein
VPAEGADVAGNMSGASGCGPGGRGVCCRVHPPQSFHPISEAVQLLSSLSIIRCLGTQYLSA